MSVPANPVEVPARVRLLACGAELTCVWSNDYGGLTFRASGVGEGTQSPSSAMCTRASLRSSSTTSTSQPSLNPRRAARAA
ncbi:hypothetical protein [Leucobacter sp. wl10]|uniref:hypothetical protein n=1 Tax=Leucobacter sp. wl10 TaxID=2304677 RepID=UPI0013C34CB9|nr:hypothetical protein [Leucobacter sp. wl10]